MAFHPPDPKRVEADRRRAESDRRRVAQRHEDDVAEIQRRKREARENERVASEIRDCYSLHTPKQVAEARSMIEAGEREEALAEARAKDAVCWERLGESRGGKQRKNLYRCTLVLS